MAELLKILSEANAVSGNEKEVRDIIISQIKDYTDSIEIDSMGSVIAFKKGKSSSKTIAVTAHMDEPGFIVSSVTDKGYLKFKAVGQIDPRKLVSKKVVIGENKIKGVIGMKAIHLQTRSERENVVPVGKLFIDIGAKDRADAEKRISLGNYVTFDTEFDIIDARAKGKALDRSGVCASAINALKDDYPYDVYFVFLAQSEVGARGAKIVSERINPDVILTVSSTDTEDMYGCKDEIGCKIGHGIAVNYSDRGVISDKALTDKMTKEAEKSNITVQKRVIKAFTSDSGALQTSASAVPCINAVIPCRYSHSPVSLMSLDDIQSGTEYIKLFLNKIGEMI